MDSRCGTGGEDLDAGFTTGVAIQNTLFSRSRDRPSFKLVAHAGFTSGVALEALSGLSTAATVDMTSGSMHVVFIYNNPFVCVCSGESQW